MNSNIFPNCTSLSPTSATFDLENSDDIVELARQIIDERCIGIFTTIDESGFPLPRWMGHLSCEDFPRIVTITSSRSRKVEQIRRIPRVSWMFSNQDFTLVLNLTGKAHVLINTSSIKRAWKKIKNKSHTHFLNNLSDKPEMVIIETIVEHIDCTIPKLGFRLSRDIGPQVSQGIKTLYRPNPFDSSPSPELYLRRNAALN